MGRMVQFGLQVIPIRTICPMWYELVLAFSYDWVAWYKSGTTSSKFVRFVRCGTIWSRHFRTTGSHGTNPERRHLNSYDLSNMVRIGAGIFVRLGRMVQFGLQVIPIRTMWYELELAFSYDGRMVRIGPMATKFVLWPRKGSSK